MALLKGNNRLGGLKGGILYSVFFTNNVLFLKVTCVFYLVLF